MQSLLADREFGDGAHFSYQFQTDGKFDGTEMGTKVRGTWRTRQREFCWMKTQPVEPENCYEVEVSGSSIRFLRFGSEMLFGTLSGKRGSDIQGKEPRK